MDNGGSWSSNDTRRAGNSRIIFFLKFLTTHSDPVGEADLVECRNMVQAERRGDGSGGVQRRFGFPNRAKWGD